MARRNKRLERQVATQRIVELHELAEDAALEGADDLAARYAGLARSIGMRYLVGVPTPLRRRTCGGCGAYVVPGRSARVRMARGKVSRTCLSCGHVDRVPHVRERKERRDA